MADHAAKPTLAIVVTLIWGILLIPGLLGAVTSPMFFDAPGSMQNPAAWTNMLIIVSFPCLCVVSIITSWINFAWQKRSGARRSLIAPIVAAVLPLIPIAYVASALVIQTGSMVARHEAPGLHTTIIRH